MNVNLNFGPYYDQISRWILTQTNAAGYFVILSIILVGILIVLIYVSERFKYSRILFIICSLLTIFIFRGISLYADCFNPDEALHLANAIALLHDRRLWVATDTMTVGPFLSILILIVYKIINLFFLSAGITFFLLRLIGIIIVSISFILLLIIFESRVNRKIAWAISLFFIMFFSFSFADGTGTLQDLQAVNTEYPCMLFITIFLYAVYKFKHKNNIFLLITAGFALGIMPFIKLQVVPICIALALWGIYLVLKKKYVLFGERKVKKYYAFLVCIGTAALPSIILSLYCLTYKNGIRNAFLFYILNAVSYTSGHTLIDYVKYFMFDLFPSFLLKYAWFKSISILIMITFIASLVIMFVKKFKAKISSDFFLSCILLLFSIEAVGHTMWNSTHYIILMVVPALIFLMETVVLLTTAEYEWIKLPKLYTPKTQQALRRDNVIAFCLVMLTIILLSSFPKLVSKNTVLSGGWGVIGYSFPFVTYTAQYVAEQTTHDDYIVVWGWDWAQAIYAYANRKSGTAQVQFERIMYHRYSSENIDIYISDIIRNKPKLIIDAIGSAWYYDRETYGLENHAQIWPAIRDDYTLTGVIDFGYGIYYLVYSRNLT
jgi:hypothetical protein